MHEGRPCLEAGGPGLRRRDLARPACVCRCVLQVQEVGDQIRGKVEDGTYK